jgi:hypothetical protein
MLSTTEAPVMALGPAFDATIVYVVCVPGTSEVTLFVLVIERSPIELIVSVSVALLLPGAGSGTAPGGVTVAVLTSEPVAVGNTDDVTVNVAVEPGARLTVVLIPPLPLGAAQLPPAEAAQVHVAAPNFEERGSVTVAPLTALGPLFLTVIEYVTPVPAVTAVTPSVFVIERSACGVSMSVSLAVLLSGFVSMAPSGGVTVTVFVTNPAGAAGSGVALTRNVAVPPFNRLTRVLMFPVPLAARQLEPWELVHVHETFVKTAGRGSETGTPNTSFGPLFLTTMT